ncbi:asparaginyl-tRNA synthetase [Hesseltinella vesiculosa]|uniref:Asparagine--tRNA ligase, mitochondrial n=1 Tax=Hesseltinella vesiculosa TaxID=101127 RepID=A0A1X2GU73_9FUNG|nr:asparaginyl-tRNA synthetase [Hesseltinella vesiculosa]
MAKPSVFPTKTIRGLLNDKPAADPVTIRGWIRSVRQQKQLSFANINDGSNLKGIQAILTGSDASKLSTGACVELKGMLVASPGKEQSQELQVSEIKVLGECDNSYPLQKKRHSLEFMRSINHLRARGNTGSAVLRMRNAASEGIQRFFASEEFIQVHTPLLTSSDCEGAGEVFGITPSDFFKQPVYLTVSGQLHAEIMATAMGRVYTFGPVFRAEPSLTSRHLAEFWMVEAEMTFLDNLDQLLDVTEANVQETTRHVLDRCADDMAFFNQWVDKSLLARLEKSIQQPFVRMSYTEAVDVLQRAKHTFQFPTTWGSSLQSEHERYLASAACCDRPVFVTDYPAELKPFYMRANDADDGRTVACFDLLMPGIGELVGGSMREERHDVLLGKMKHAGMKMDDYQWYLDLRKYGSAPHGGYGIGFERLMLWLTGLDNVREVVPVPRWVGHCRY